MSLQSQNAFIMIFAKRIKNRKKVRVRVRVRVRIG